MAKWGFNQYCDFTATWVQTWKNSLVPLGFDASSNDCIITMILRTSADESIPFLLIHFLDRTKVKTHEKAKESSNNQKGIHGEHTFQNPPPPSHAQRMIGGRVVSLYVRCNENSSWVIDCLQCIISQCPGFVPKIRIKFHS